MAISLSLEANELLENFQLKNARGFSKYFKTHNQELFDELADVIIWIPTISHDLNIKLHKAVTNKVKKNAQKYPLKQSKNTTKIIRNI
jgi:NTP pyrophosphatase (non-canonical NTP hydrolase)